MQPSWYRRDNEALARGEQPDMATTMASGPLDELIERRIELEAGLPLNNSGGEGVRVVDPSEETVHSINYSGGQAPSGLKLRLGSEERVSADQSRDAGAGVCSALVKLRPRRPRRSRLQALQSGEGCGSAD